MSNVTSTESIVYHIRRYTDSVDYRSIEAFSTWLRTWRSFKNESRNEYEFQNLDLHGTEILLTALFDNNTALQVLGRSARWISDLENL